MWCRVFTDPRVLELDGGFILVQALFSCVSGSHLRGDYSMHYSRRRPLTRQFSHPLFRTIGEGKRGLEKAQRKTKQFLSTGTLTLRRNYRCGEAELRLPIRFFLTVKTGTLSILSGPEL